MVLRRSPTGFGGSQLLVADLRVPTRLRLRLDADAVKKAAGQAGARRVRARIRNKQVTGLPSGWGLFRTGELQRSIRYDRFRERIRPVGKREDAGAATRQRHEGLLWVLIHTGRKKNGGTYPDPMEQDDAINNTMVRAAERNIAKQLASGKAGLIAELRRVR